MLCIGLILCYMFYLLVKSVTYREFDTFPTQSCVPKCKMKLICLWHVTEVWTNIPWGGNCLGRFDKRTPTFIKEEYL